MRLFFWLFFLSTVSYSQKFEAPRFELSQKLDGAHIYYNFLNVRDKSALIIKFNIYNSYSQPKLDTYLVFERNGKVYRYDSLSLLKDNSSVVKCEVVNDEKQLLQDMLSKIQSEKMLEIDLDSLNAKPVNNFEVFDANHYNLEIVEADRFSGFYSYALEDYIAKKSVGFIDKQKFLNLIYFIDSKNKQKMNEDLEFLQSLTSKDTVYIRYEKNKNLSKRAVDYSSLKNDAMTEYSFNVNPLLNFILLRREVSPSKNAIGRIPYYKERLPKSFFKNDNIVDLDLLKKYHLYVYEYLKNKTVFVIEKEKGKLYKKEVQLRR